MSASLKRDLWILGVGEVITIGLLIAMVVTGLSSDALMIAFVVIGTATSVFGMWKFFLSPPRSSR